MTERDVIVVGAGPGGATAATLLAQKGYDVLLLDRSGFPRDKVCGDAVPAGAFDVLYALGMEEMLRAAGFYYVDKIRLVSPKGYVMDADMGEPGGSKSAIVPRYEFDVLLQQYAVAAGAEFVQAQVKEPLLEDGRVVGVRARVGRETKEFHSPLVIGADGVTSTIARAIRPDTQEDGHKAVALRAYAQELEVLPRRVEFYLYDEILPGYAWIFPLGEQQANIGLGMRLDTFRSEGHDLKEMLARFLEMPEIKKRLRNGGALRDVATWQLSLGSQLAVQRAYDGALLVGDAAGLIDPLTGGGIGNAVNSGWLAAITAHAAFLKGDFSRETLAVYEGYCEAYMGPGLRRSYLLQRMMGVFPAGVDWIVSRARHDSAFAQMFMTKL